jgi:hypothetical protein
MDLQVEYFLYLLQVFRYIHLRLRQIRQVLQGQLGLCLPQLK